jgi:hypothetical protein
MTKDQADLYWLVNQCFRGEKDQTWTDYQWRRIKTIRARLKKLRRRELHCNIQGRAKEDGKA